ncbi:MAG TPA: hypothetical protein VLS90_00370, partial [Thermodesulfobacteriota bacterium]|nr:hypothetical protein [Thermodesulfobacteriota bacterium]
SKLALLWGIKRLFDENGMDYAFYRRMVMAILKECFTPAEAEAKHVPVLDQIRCSPAAAYLDEDMINELCQEILFATRPREEEKR